jgi:hypothetical protein
MEYFDFNLTLSTIKVSNLGIFLCSFQARDADKTSHVTYSIIEGNVNNLFSINPQSGEITVSDHHGLDMTNVSKDVIVLTVQVSF